MRSPWAVLIAALALIGLFVLAAMTVGYHAAQQQQSARAPQTIIAPAAAPPTTIQAIMGSPGPGDQTTPLPVDAADVPPPPPGPDGALIQAHWRQVLARYPHPRYFHGVALQPGSVVVNDRVYPPYATILLR